MPATSIYLGTIKAPGFCNARGLVISEYGWAAFPKVLRGVLNGLGADIMTRNKSSHRAKIRIIQDKISFR